jgi:hypothetical protein
MLNPMQFQGYPEIRASDLSTSDARRSRSVDSAEFQKIAHRGAGKLVNRMDASQEPKGLNKNWDHVVDHAYEASREEWGGTTVHSRTGKPLGTKGNQYALTVRDPGMESVSVKPDAPKEQFAGAMEEARSRYSSILSRKDHHLGVFHDADKGSIDIDPVVVVKNRRDVEDIGAYTRATGGAYHFKSGDGFWPPHVKG